jgi:hypothetical protein
MLIDYCMEDQTATISFDIDRINQKYDSREGEAEVAMKKVCSN